MQNVLIVGAGKGGTLLLDLLSELPFMRVKAIIDKDERAPGILKAKKSGIASGKEWAPFLTSDIQIIFDVTGEPAVFQALMQAKSSSMIVIPGTIANLLVGLLEDYQQAMNQIQNEIQKQNLIFNAMEDGMIAINVNGDVDVINENACNHLAIQVEEAIGQPIQTIIPTSGLLRVLQTGKPEINEEVYLPNGMKIVSSRYPLFSAKGHIVGAFSVFRDVTEIVKLAEEITDLKQIKTMLEAIIHSSDDAISVVDEKGNGVLVNPAYTRLTGLTEDEVIGKPATVDISEGESIHLQVLQTKKPVRGVQMRIGETKRDVIVNVAPIIVDQTVKGSVGVIHDITEMRNLMRQLDEAKAMIRKLESTYTFADIAGTSLDIQFAIEQAKIAAKSSVPVLLRGESGTGKELFAHAIHNESFLRGEDFVRVNCQAMESATITMDRDGFVDTVFNQEGVVAGTEKGTLFLDDIADLTSNAQVRLLQYLKNNTDAQRSPPITRLVAATSKNLERLLHEGVFHEELYYFLSRFTIHITPLRERKQDIQHLTQHLLIKLNQEFGTHVEGLSAAALEWLESYNWPGNVRELENVISRAMIFMTSTETIIHEDVIKKSLSTNEEKKEEPILLEKSTLAAMMDEYEKSILEKALEENRWNKSLTANRLGISLRSLYYKLEKYQLI